MVEITALISEIDSPLIFVYHRFASPSWSARSFSRSRLVWGLLLVFPAKAAHGHESPLSCLDVRVMFLVRLWTSNSGNTQEGGLDVVYRFLRIKSIPCLSATIGIPIRNKSALHRRPVSIIRPLHMYPEVLRN